MIEKLQKLANEHPEFRKHLIPILKQAAGGSLKDNWKILADMDIKMSTEFRNDVAAYLVRFAKKQFWTGSSVTRKSEDVVIIDAPQYYNDKSYRIELFFPEDPFRIVTVSTRQRITAKINGKEKVLHFMGGSDSYENPVMVGKWIVEQIKKEMD